MIGLNKINNRSGLDPIASDLNTGSASKQLIEFCASIASITRPDRVNAPLELHGNNNDY